MARLAKSYWQWVDPGMAEDLHEAELEAWWEREAKAFVRARISDLTDRFILLEQYKKQGMERQHAAHDGATVARQTAQWLLAKSEQPPEDWSVADRSGLRPEVGSDEYKALAHRAASLELDLYLLEWRTDAQAALTHFATYSDTAVQVGGKWPDKKKLSFLNKCTRVLEGELFRVAKIIDEEQWMPRTFAGDTEAVEEEE